MPPAGDSNEGPVLKGFPAIQEHVKKEPIDFVLWLSRIFTVIFALGYLIPIFGNAQNAYQKMLLAGALTSALRLYHRVEISQLGLNKETAARVLREDACHYLIYSMLFLYVRPVFLILIPVTVFAFLHFSSYSSTLLDVYGPNSCFPARIVISVVEFQASNLLRLIAFAEIMIAPLTVLLLFTGGASLFTPFLYCQFLVLRYASQRNAHTRNMFYKLRVAADAFSMKPMCPGMVRMLIHKAIEMISRMAPPIQQQEQRRQ